MKKIYSLLAIGGLALSLSAISFGQDAGPQGGQLGAQKRQGGRMHGGGKHMAKLQAEVLAKLNLTADQKAKIEALNKNTQTEVKTIVTEGQGGDRQEIGKKIREVQKNHRESLNKILTPAQQAKFKELMMAKMKELRAKREKDGKGRQGAPPPPSA